MVLIVKLHVSLLPVARMTEEPAPPAGLAFDVRGANGLDLNFIQLFDSISYLRLVGLFMNTESVTVFRVRKVHSLFCNQRLNYDIVIVHLNNPAYYLTQRFSLSLPFCLFIRDIKASFVKSIFCLLHISPALSSRRG